MENVILTIHLILALLLIGVVLLQRSEGGGLGMGGGGGSGVVSARGAANALTKLTWIFAVGFIITSITLTIIAAREADSGSVINQIGGTPTPAKPETPAAPLGGDLLPPAQTDAPLAPPRPDAATEGNAAPAAPAAPAQNN